MYVLEQARNGMVSERPKWDGKQAWYDLSKNSGEEELAKDLAAVANTPGGTGFIFVGVNEKGDLFDSPFSKSNARDEADVQSKMLKRIQPRVQWHYEELFVEGTRIGVFVIPKSSARPHVVTRHGTRENYIPIRSGTRTNSASRWDLDDMYGDRMNDQQPVLTPISPPVLRPHGVRGDGRLIPDALILKASVITGSRPVVLTGGHIHLWCAMQSERFSFGLRTIGVKSLDGEESLRSLPLSFAANQGHIVTFYIQEAGRLVEESLEPYLSTDITYKLVVEQANGRPFEVVREAELRSR